MALVNCPQCGQSVSDKAVKCPHCGTQIMQTTFKHTLSQKAAKTWKIVISIFVALCGIISILPLTNVFGYFLGGGASSLFYLQKTPLFCLAIGFACIGGLLCLGLFGYGLMRLIKGKTSSLKYWVCSLIIAIVSVVGTYGITILAYDSLDDLRRSKIYAVEGTYEWVSKRDGSVNMVSIGNRFNLYAKYHGKEGYVDRIYYNYERDELGVIMIIDGEEIGGPYDADMKFVETKSGRVPVKKISDEVILWNEDHTSIRNKETSGETAVTSQSEPTTSGNANGDPYKVSELYQSGKINEGMTEDQILALCGQPRKKSRTSSGFDWEYGEGIKYVSISFKEGKVWHVWDYVELSK